VNACGYVFDGSTKKTCEVTLIPGRVARWFGAETRIGIAYRSHYDTEDEDGENYREVVFRWKTTGRYVGWGVMRAIEAAPVQSLDDMTVEQLLLDDTSKRNP
jgi:hypothetical protein